LPADDSLRRLAEICSALSEGEESADFLEASLILARSGAATTSSSAATMKSAGATACPPSDSR
jgi:hypothetical protein